MNFVVRTNPHSNWKIKGRDQTLVDLACAIRRVLAVSRRGLQFYNLVIVFLLCDFVYFKKETRSFPLATVIRDLIKSYTSKVSCMEPFASAVKPQGNVNTHLTYSSSFTLMSISSNSGCERAIDLASMFGDRCKREDERG